MKKISLSVLLTLCVAVMTGCGGREIDDIAYVVAIGVDLTAPSQYEFTFAIGNPGSISGGGESSGGGDDNVLVIKSAVGEDIFTASDTVSALTGQKINLSHTELMVFSYDAAYNGAQQLIEGLLRNLNQRPKLVPITTSSTAKELILSIHSEFEGNPEKYLKKVLEGASRSSVDIRDFLSRAKTSYGGGAVLNCIGSDSGILADSISVFRQGKMTGRIYDVDAYKILCADLGEINYSINSAGTLYLKQRVKPHIDVKCDSSPEIFINIPLDSTVQSIASGVDGDALRQMVKAELEERIKKMLYYISTDVKTDSLGFFKYARKKFFTEQDFYEYNWQDKFHNTVFNVKVDVVPERTGLIKGEM